LEAKLGSLFAQTHFGTSTNLLIGSSEDLI
jgi:hypothetical protein